MAELTDRVFCIYSEQAVQREAKAAGPQRTLEACSWGGRDRAVNVVDQNHDGDQVCDKGSRNHVIILCSTN